MILRGAIVFAALAVLGASLGMTASRIWHTGGKGWTLAIWMSAGLGAAGLKVMLGVLLHDRKLPGWYSVAAIWAICFAFDSQQLSGFASATKDAGTLELKAKAAHRTKLEAAVRDKRAALDKQAPTRAAEVVRATLDTAKREAGRCDASRAYMDACQKLAAAEGENATVIARARLVSELEEAQRAVEQEPEVIVYPEARRVGGVLRSLGFDASDERIAGLLALVFVLLADFAPIVAIRAAMQPIPEPPAPAAPRTPRTPARAAPNAPAVPTKPSPHAGAVHAALKQAASGNATPGVSIRADGSLCFAQRSIAGALQLSPRAFKDALDDLAARNVVAYRATKSGTVVTAVN
jgi:hypothetical protein